MRRFRLCLLLTAALRVGAQEIDTAIAGHTASGRFTILDQIENREERETFTRLYKQRDAARRRQMASAFVASYPASWLLAEVYEIAAKASIDLNDFPAAVDFGRKSLRLWPENPLLLVPLAGVEARMASYAAAVESARAALWCIDRFDRPGSIRTEDWPALRQSLLATSYLVLGRVAAARGLSARGAMRDRYLSDAADNLDKAIALDRTDPEGLYLMGLVSSGRRRTDLAAAWFAEAWRRRGALESESLSRLKEIYGAAARAKDTPFDKWVDSLRATFPAPAREQTTAAAAPEYAGSQSCTPCHEREYASWKATGMGRMFREYRPENVSGDFSGSVALSDESGAPSVRVLSERGRPFFDVRDADGRWRRYPVEYTIGSKWQQAYATKFPSGGIQVFPVQFNLLRKTWVNYWKTIDPPGSARVDSHRFASAVPSATYQFNCAPCHTSQLRFDRGRLEARAAAFAEGGVNCEMCHGPSGGHVAAMRSPTGAARSASATPVKFKTLAAERYVTICAQCHMQSSARAPDQDGSVNFSEAGPDFYRTPPSRPYIDFSRKAFYKDGRFRVTTFIVESFVRTACYRKGGATCGSCHNPHPDDPAKNPVSLKYAADSDEMCVQCHKDAKLRSQAHTRHGASAEGSRCVSCHMPRIMEAVLFDARSHQMDDIPDPETTARFGRAESPNACLLCHKDKDAPWLSASLSARLP